MFRIDLDIEKGFRRNHLARETHPLVDQPLTLFETEEGVASADDESAVSSDDPPPSNAVGSGGHPLSDDESRNRAS